MKLTFFLFQLVAKATLSHLFDIILFESILGLKAI